MSELENKIEELKPNQDKLEPIDYAHDFERNKAYIEHRKEFPYYPDKHKEDDTFKRYESYREWDKTHDNYKVLYAPDGIDEHGKIIKYDKEKK